MHGGGHGDNHSTHLPCLSLSLVHLTKQMTAHESLWWLRSTYNFISWVSVCLSCPSCFNMFQCCCTGAALPSMDHLQEDKCVIVCTGYFNWQGLDRSYVQVRLPSLRIWIRKLDSGPPSLVIICYIMLYLDLPSLESQMFRYRTLWQICWFDFVWFCSVHDTYAHLANVLGWNPAEAASTWIMAMATFGCGSGRKPCRWLQLMATLHTPESPVYQIQERQLKCIVTLPSSGSQPQFFGVMDLS